MKILATIAAFALVLGSAGFSMGQTRDLTPALTESDHHVLLRLTHLSVVELRTPFVGSFAGQQYLITPPRLQYGRDGARRRIVRASGGLYDPDTETEVYAYEITVREDNRLVRFAERVHRQRLRTVMQLEPTSDRHRASAGVLLTRPADHVLRRLEEIAGRPLGGEQDGPARLLAIGMAQRIAENMDALAPRRHHDGRRQ